MQASSLAQAFQHHLAAHLSKRGCPWCPFASADTLQDSEYSQRLSALWHIMALHPREYADALRITYGTSTTPAAAAFPAMRREDWQNVPEPFRARFPESSWIRSHGPVLPPPAATFLPPLAEFDPGSQEDNVADV